MLQISVGCVRQRFARHIAILVLMDACASALGWFFTGYAFAFGDNLTADGSTAGNAFIGTNYFAMANLSPGANNVNSYYLWFFEWAVRPVPLPWLAQAGSSIMS